MMLNQVRLNLTQLILKEVNDVKKKLQTDRRTDGRRDNVQHLIRKAHLNFRLGKLKRIDLRSKKRFLNVHCLILSLPSEDW